MNNSAIDNGWMREMFDSVPRRYRLLNKILTFGQDEFWRQRALEMIKAQAGDKILDVCTGTADLALKIAKRFTGLKIYALDFSSPMLGLAKKKTLRNGTKNLVFIESDCTNMGLGSNHFNYITIAFGFRNLAFSKENLLQSLKEIYRILKNGGRFIVIETSQPINLFIRRLFHFYATRIVPRLGAFFSGQRFAYTYLGTSIIKFLDPQQLDAILVGVGFKRNKVVPLWLGIICLSIYDKC